MDDVYLMRWEKFGKLVQGCVIVDVLLQTDPDMKRVRSAIQLGIGMADDAGAIKKRQGIITSASFCGWRVNRTCIIEVTEASGEFAVVG